MNIGLPHLSPKTALAVLGGVIVVCGLGYGAYYAYALYKDLRATEAELAARTVAFESSIDQLQQRIAEVEKENEELTGTLTDEQKKNLALEREKRRNEREIDELTKLTTLDPELLKKYSKVYFLSENYAPPKLEDVDVAYLANPANPMQILDDVAPFLEDLLEEATEDGVALRIISAYRSFQTQTSLKGAYTVQYGSGANRFSADQGYSEHQMGTTVDFTTPTLNNTSIAFEGTTAFAWLNANAYKYGFTLSYPKGNQYYIYEPWHWRFVGQDLARYLRNEGKSFYELDQRFIDEFLLDIFE